jgi:hypothetical protein
MTLYAIFWSYSLRITTHSALPQQKIKKLPDEGEEDEETEECT